MTRPRHTPVDLAAVAGDDELVEALRRGIEPAGDGAPDPAAELMLALLRDVDSEPDVLQLPDSTTAGPSLIRQRAGALSTAGARARSGRASRRAAAGTAVVALSMLCVSGVAAAVTDRPGLAPYVGALQRGAAALRDFTQSRQAPPAEAGRVPVATATPEPTSSGEVRSVRPEMASALDAVQSLAVAGRTEDAQEQLDALMEEMVSASPQMSPDELSALDDADNMLDPATPGGTPVNGWSPGADPTGADPTGTGDPSATPTDTPTDTPDPTGTPGPSPDPDPDPSTTAPTPDSSDDPTAATPQPSSSLDPSPSPSTEESPTSTPTGAEQAPTQTAGPETTAAAPETTEAAPETTAAAPETTAAGPETPEAEPVPGTSAGSGEAGGATPQA